MTNDSFLKDTGMTNKSYSIKDVLENIKVYETKKLKEDELSDEQKSRMAENIMEKIKQIPETPQEKYEYFFAVTKTKGGAHINVEFNDDNATGQDVAGIIYKIISTFGIEL